jgi:hypothetical protein
VDRQTRKNIKTDKFAEEIGHTFSFLTSHSDETKRYAVMGLAVLVVAIGIYYFTVPGQFLGFPTYPARQAATREQALADAIKVDEAVINATPQPPRLNFPTQEAKDKARTKAFSDVAVKYHGSQEGAMAGIYIAAEQVDKGNYPGAEKLYQDVADSASADYASLAKLSLAGVYAAEGKNSDAENLIRSLIAHPTTLVSKEQATIQLADMLIPTKPDEAKKLLQPLTTSTRAAISRAAIDEMGKLVQPN